MPGNNIHILATKADHDNLLGQAGNSLTVIDFHATWCGPCKTIAPIYERLADSFAQVRFAKCDVDANPAVARIYQVSAMPTFVFIKDSKPIDQVRGADAKSLLDKIRKHASSSTDSNPTSSSSSSSSSSPSQAWVSNLDRSQLSCLNESPNHPVTNILDLQESYLESEADEQLLISVPFNSLMKLRAIKFTTPTDSTDKGPRTIKLFLDQPNLGFEDAESQTPVQEMVLSEEQAKGESNVELRFVKFQKVGSLQIFVADNQGGGEITRLKSLTLIGQSVETTTG